MEQILETLRKIWDSSVQYVTQTQFEFKNIIEIIVLAILLYYIFAWIKSTRTWFLFRGVILILLFFLIANLLNMNVIVYIAEKTLSILVIALLIIFQPELRAGLERLGQQNYLMDILEGSNSRTKKQVLHTHQIIEELADAVFNLAKNNTGALIVIERELPLEEYIRTGIQVDAVVSSALLINIFEHNTPLHDGAVIIKGYRIAAATCYRPLSSNPQIEKSLGTRHRAAIGVSEQTDSVTIVVSEETGQVSLAESGVLRQNVSPSELRAGLASLEQTPDTEKARRLRRDKKKKKEAETPVVLLSPGEAGKDTGKTALLYTPEETSETPAPAGETAEEPSERRGKSRRKGK